MNLKQLSKQIGNTFRFRPLPARLDGDGSRLPESDDQWRLDAIPENPTRLRLVNIHTGHVLELGSDNVREYRSPDFLLLRCNLFISAQGIRIEPIVQQPQAPSAVPSGSSTISLRGAPLDLLRYCVQRESARLFDWAEADDAMAALDLTAVQYRNAAEELADLGLVSLLRNGNHASGIARTILHPHVFLATASLFLPGINFRDELKALFEILRQVPEDHYRIRVQEILKRNLMPLPRLDLTLRGLEDLGYLVGHGPGHQDWGSSLDLEITTKGRRMLRGDDPYPY